jgi:hypothetical protein
VLSHHWVILLTQHRQPPNDELVLDEALMHILITFLQSGYEDLVLDCFEHEHATPLQVAPLCHAVVNLYAHMLHILAYVHVLARGQPAEVQKDEDCEREALPMPSYTQTLHLLEDKLHTESSQYLQWEQLNMLQDLKPE